LPTAISLANCSRCAGRAAAKENGKRFRGIAKALDTYRALLQFLRGSIAAARNTNPPAGINQRADRKTSDNLPATPKQRRRRVDLREALAALASSVPHASRRD